MTSHDVVSAVRKATKVKQVGHAGTLDPLASGVLPIAVGRACRLIRYLPEDKVYRAEFLLGQTTTTDDIEGEIIGKSDNGLPDQESIESILRGFIGEQMQRPPFYSAVHHKGERLYELARRGELPEDIKERPVSIYSIDVLSFSKPVLLARISCGKGTYIRSIARDLGEKLGVGGCLQSLIRESSAGLHLTESFTLDQIKCAGENNRLAEIVTPPLSVFSGQPGMDLLTVGRDLAIRIAHGQALSVDELAYRGGENLVAVAYQDDLIAICRREADDRLHPEVVTLNADQVA